MDYWKTLNIKRASNMSLKKRVLLFLKWICTHFTTCHLRIAQSKFCAQALRIAECTEVQSVLCPKLGCEDRDKHSNPSMTRKKNHNDSSIDNKPHPH